MATLFDYTGESYTGDQANLYNAVVAVQFTTTDAINATSYKLDISTFDVGYPGTLTGAIYSDSSGSLGTLVDGSAADVSVTGEGIIYTMTPSSAVALSATTTYWLRFNGSAGLSCKTQVKYGGGTHRIYYGGTYVDSCEVEAGLFYSAAATGQFALPSLGATVIAGIVPTAAQYLFQHATPSGDIADGNWLHDGGTNVNMCFHINDGSVYDDADYIRSGTTPANDTYICEMTPIVTPEAGTVTIKVRARYC